MTKDDLIVFLAAGILGLIARIFVDSMKKTA